MRKQIVNTNFEVLTKDSLIQLNGGGPTWDWLGETIGNIKNTIEDAWENWKNNSDAAIRSMPY